MPTVEGLGSHDPLDLLLHLSHRLGGGFETVAAITEPVRRLAKARQNGLLPEGCFLDIGAHRGMVSLAAKNLGWKRVVAVEPNGRNYKCLLENMALAGHEGDTIIRAAVVGKACGMSVIVRSIHGSSGQCSVFYRPLRNAAEERVAAIRFVDLVRDHGPIGACKMDIEGGEYGILDGSDEVVETLRQIPWLDIEFHGEDWGGFSGIEEGADAMARETLRRAGFDVGEDDSWSGRRRD